MAKGKRKNKILKIAGYVNLIVFLISALMIDSTSWIPFIVCVVTGGYLALFAYANNWFDDWRLDDAEDLIDAHMCLDSANYYQNQSEQLSERVRGLTDYINDKDILAETEEVLKAHGY